MIAALRGGSGKTILSIGLIAAWKKSNKSIAPFKKGPDYIDTGWLALAADRPCYNLDTFLIDTPQILQSFLANTGKDDIAVIEGNRGLYDGIDLAGSTSTAELAKLLKTPVLLCVDCTKITRTMAPVISGLIQFDPNVMIKGVVLNRVAGGRHERILRVNIEHYCGIPVLGAIPKLQTQIFPERHMGLVPTPEHDWAGESIEAAAQVASKHIDLDAIYELIQDLPPLEATEVRGQKTEDRRQRTEGEINTSDGISIFGSTPRIGIIKDAAFQFYYPENIDALKAAGAETFFISPLAGESLPELDALYIGGGFPETHAEALAENLRFRNSLKSLADSGLPIYAECGGLMYLGEKLVLKETSYPMAGVLPIVYGFSKKPQGHGYTIFSVEKKNPYFDIGSEYRGHEFHYSKVLEWRGSNEGLAFRMKRGSGIHNQRDGACYNNVLATYTHLHALGAPAWAKTLVRNAAAYRQTSANAQK